MDKEQEFDAIKELKENELPVFKSSQEMANMTIDTFIVPQASFYEMKERFVLPRDFQSKVIEKLVDETPNWLDLEEEEQVAEIKMKLILETVAQYLYAHDYISENCTMYDNGFDKNGNVMLNAFYVKDTEKGQAVQVAIDKKKQKQSKKVTSLADYKKKKEEQQ